MKIIVTIMVTLLLNILCEKGLSFVSWMIVFIPFILMTVIVSMLLYVFGLDTSTGTLNYNKNSTSNENSDNINVDVNGNIIIYDPTYNPKLNPIYYRYPNIIIPQNPNQYQNPNVNQNVNENLNVNQIVPYGTSDPEYYS
jgi:hypothetical protein